MLQFIDTVMTSIIAITTAISWNNNGRDVSTCEMVLSNIFLSSGWFIMSNYACNYDFDIFWHLSR